MRIYTVTCSFFFFFNLGLGAAVLCAQALPTVVVVSATGQVVVSQGAGYNRTRGWPLCFRSLSLTLAGWFATPACKALEMWRFLTSGLVSPVVFIQSSVSSRLKKGILRVQQRPRR